MDDTILILIPAKGASTRLPRKNMRLLGGKPLLGWAIDSAQSAQLGPHVIVSTEDEEIAAYAESRSVEVLLRPEKLAVDPAGVVDVALHAIECLRDRGREFKTIVILLPTCPFRTSDDIREAHRLFKNKQAEFLMSVSMYSHTPFAALKLNPNGCLEPHFPDYIGLKAQQMPAAFRANGAVHVLDVAAFEHARSYYAQPLIGYVMPPNRSIDIDREEDLRLAECMLAKIRP